MRSRSSRLFPPALAVVLTLGTTAALPGFAADNERTRAADRQAAKSDHDTTIRLKSRAFKPAPGLERAAIAGSKAQGEKVHFIAQFAPVPRAADRRAFAREGVELLTYLGGGAYAATAPAGGLGKLARLPGFRWAGPLKAADKTDPSLRAGKVPSYARTGDGKVALTVQVHGDKSVGDAAAIARAHGGKVVSKIPSIPSVTAIFPAKAAAGLAAEDAVLYVAPMDAPLEAQNDGVVPAINATPLAAAPYGLTGAGVTVMVYDVGTAQHSDYAGRTVQTDTDAGIRVGEHASHVAGTVLADGANSNGNDSAGNPNGGTANQWAGVAPGANLATYGLQGTTDVLYDSPGDLNANATNGVNGGIDILTMSLGNNTGSNGLPCGQLGDYTNTSILIDQIVRGSINGQELIYFESAGNDRNDGCAPADGFRTITSPSPAKNSIVVGAVNSNDDSMTAFSSWGPVDDGRLRPDLVGPGCQSTGDGVITSTSFDDTPGNVANNNGLLDAGETTNSYIGMCGTSMSTPALAGLGALLVQQWRTTYGAGTRPLPHAMKAVLAHSADDLGTAGPDYANGFGQPDGQRAADLVRAGNLITSDQVDQGATDTFYFTLDGTTDPRVTLAWSDPEAARNSTTQLINNVDLVVTAPDGTVHRPQVLDPANPANASAEGVDNLNVIEMVTAGDQAGTWKVQVSGTTVPTGPAAYTLVTPTRATTNAPPTANAGGPYAAQEGQTVGLDASASTDPEGLPLSYAWDLDNDGAFDDTTGATPTFPAQGQDGTYTVAVQVTDSEGNVATDTAVVNVANVAPSVTINPIAAINEGGSVTVTGLVSDPGWLDGAVLAATITWDDGSPAETLTGSRESVAPDGTFTFTSAPHQYGDNGAFTVTVTATDDDTSTQASSTATVDNVVPTVALDGSGEQSYGGQSAFVLQAGETLTVPARSTDPGSDDLVLTWAWGDGSSSSRTSLVNPPATDPAKSPSVDPRDVTLSADHAYGDACLYTLSATSADDDGGTSPADTASVIVTGTADLSRGHGWWLNQYRAKSGNDFTPARLQCYLDIVGFFSKVFSEDTDASTRAAATKVLNAPAKSPEAVIFDQHALGAWLNFANGSVDFDTLLDTDGDGVRDTSFADVMLAAETVRLDPSSTSAQVKAQKDVIARIITQGR